MTSGVEIQLPIMPLWKIQGVEGGDDAARAIAVFVWSLLPDGLREIVLAVSEKTSYGRVFSI